MTTDEIRTLAIAAACVDSGVIKVADETSFEQLIQAVQASDKEDPAEKVSHIIEALADGDHEKLAAITIGGLTIGKKDPTMVQRAMQAISDAHAHPVMKYAPGAVLGILLGSYFGNKAKEKNDLYGLPYNYEYEF